MKKIINVLYSLFFINIMIILSFYFYYSKIVKINKDHFAKVEKNIDRNENTIKKLIDIESNYKSINLSIDSLIEIYTGEVENKVKPVKTMDSIKNGQQDQEEIKKLEIESSEETMGSVKNYPSDQKGTIDTLISGYFEGITIVYDITYEYKLRWKQQLTPKNIRFLKIEMKSKYRSLKSEIERVTINGKEVDIIKVIEENEYVGRDIWNIVMHSYYVLVKMDNQLFPEGKNIIVVHADINYSKAIYIKK